MVDNMQEVRWMRKQFVMNKLLMLFAVGLLIASFSTRGGQVFGNDEGEDSLYKICRIKEEKSFYVIYATRRDSVFKIVGSMDSVIGGDCEEVKVGKSYALDLKVIFPSDSVLGKPVSPNLGIRGYEVSKGKIVMLEMQSHNRIYVASNLRGLCIGEGDWVHTDLTPD